MSFTFPRSILEYEKHKDSFILAMARLVLEGKATSTLKDKAEALLEAAEKRQEEIEGPTA